MRFQCGRERGAPYLLSGGTVLAADLRGFGFALPEPPHRRETVMAQARMEIGVWVGTLRRRWTAFTRIGVADILDDLRALLALALVPPPPRLVPIPVHDRRRRRPQVR